MARKVMIADDDRSIVDLLLATLRQDERYELLVANDGEEALVLARRERPDLLLLDILMPKLDGIQVCKSPKEDPSTRQITVVMLTALARKSDVAAAKAAGADEYLTKPFSPIHLLKKVDEVLGA